jgi:lipopolysaccharide biosynthesis glycosyltransferase
MAEEQNVEDLGNVIHVACCFDAKMAIPALMVAYSVRQTANVKRKTVFHAVATETGKLPENVATVLNSEFFEFRLHHVALGELETVDMTGSVISSKAAFCRILLPDIIPEAKRIIYLDSDVIVNKALDELYDIKMTNHAIAACQDYEVMAILASLDTKLADEFGRRVRALLNDPSTYFNSGVLVIETDRWRELKCSNAIVAFSKNPPVPLVLADQDALNPVFQGHYTRLDPRWNSIAKYQHALMCSDPAVQEAMAKIKCGPWITHYAAEFKPWADHHPATDEDWRFWSLAKASPFYSAVLGFYEVCAEAHRRKKPVIAHKALGEFFCTCSQFVAIIERTFGTSAAFSSRLREQGKLIYGFATAGQLKGLKKFAVPKVLL